MLMAKKKKSPNPWANKLRKLRIALGLSQAEAADRAKFAKQTWVNWENGTRGPGKLALRILRDTFPGHL